MTIQDIRGWRTSPVRVGLTLAAACGIAAVAASVAVAGWLPAGLIAGGLVAGGAVGVIAGFSTSGSV